MLDAGQSFCRFLVYFPYNCNPIDCSVKSILSRCRRHVVYRQFVSALDMQMLTNVSTDRVITSVHSQWCTTDGPAYLTWKLITSTFWNKRHRRPHIFQIDIKSVLKDLTSDESHFLRFEKLLDALCAHRMQRFVGSLINGHQTWWLPLQIHYASGDPSLTVRRYIAYTNWHICLI